MIEVIQIMSSIVGSVAVSLTVVYLAIQVRASTRATYSQTYQTAVAALGDMAAIVAESKEKSKLYAEGMADPESLDDDEYLQFAYLGISLFRKYENAYFQYRSGMIDNEFWDGHRDNLLWFFHRPGTQRWWSERRLGFSKSFREYLESTSDADMAEQGGRYV
ncbi:MAG: hypothetical protein HKN18_03200 [Silicimonas sp.]|nr:hypothetical protein [Silicimonas sp.]